MNRAVTVSGHPASCPYRRAAKHSVEQLPQQNLGPPAHLAAVMAQAGEGVLQHYSPLGCVWLLSGSAPASTESGSSKQKSGLPIRLLPQDRVIATSAAWLDESNSELLAKWEWGAEEMEPDLMEAFAWATFKETVTVDGSMIARTHCIQPQPSLLLVD